MNKTKIYYLIPDLFPRDLSPLRAYRAWKMGKLRSHIELFWLGKQKPVGGIKVMYQHCLLLQELGYDAVPLQMGNYSGNLYNYDVKAVSIKETGFDLGSDSVLVVPEIVPHIHSQFKCARKVMFAQNWRRTYSIFDDTHSQSSYIDLGYDHIMYVGDYIRTELKRDKPEDMTLVSNYIDHNIFTDDASKIIQNRILALPRKNRSDLEKIRKILKTHGIYLTYVDGLGQEALSEEYQKSDIFLTVGYPEGFGLPQLEAMACGCVVVGFTGGGASEFMIHEQTALVANDGDTKAAAALIVKVINNEELKSQLRKEAKHKAKTYTYESTKQQLSDFYLKLLS